ncbi:MAG: class I SAM-dependent methyltransferase [Terriglobia bacterium]
MDAPILKYDTEVAVSQGDTPHTLLLELTGENKIVLDVGCATGNVGKGLVQRGCRVVGIEADAGAAALASPYYETLLVADLDQLDITANLPGAFFDVVIFADILEHLKHPARVLRQVRAQLAGGGYVLASIPNIAHASVSLALLRGEFRYQELGLLDSTHVRFFTLEGVRDLFEQTGYRLAGIRRVKRGPFETEIPLKPQDIPKPVLRFALQQPEACTYEFVVQACPDSPPSVAACLPKFNGKVLVTTTQGVASADERLLQEIQRLSEPYRELSQLKQQCRYLQSRLSRYQNLPLLRTARWIRRKLLRLPDPPY